MLGKIYDIFLIAVLYFTVVCRTFTVTDVLFQGPRKDHKNNVRKCLVTTSELTCLLYDANIYLKTDAVFVFLLSTTPIKKKFQHSYSERV